MKSSALPEFWDCLEQLPPPVKKIARKNFKLWHLIGKSFHRHDFNSGVAVFQLPEIVIFAFV